MISSVNSMVLGHSRHWSTIELSFRRRYLDFLRLLYILGYIFQSDRCLEFGILNYWSSLLCSTLSGFSLSSVFWLILGELSSMQYSWNFITKKWYQISIIRHRSKTYTTGSAEDVYILIIVQSLESPTYSASYLNWYNFRPCPLFVHFTPYRNCEDAIFCKVDGL